MADQGSSPSNVACIFVAHFHVRNGNEIAWQSPGSQDCDLSGIEWKVLPSGAHLVERDIIYFRPHSRSKDDARLGVACFRNRKLSSREQLTPELSASSSSSAIDQRGARMVAVGIVVDCPSVQPSSQLDSTLPHIPDLANFAELLAATPAEADASEAYERLTEYHRKHAANDGNHSADRMRRMSKLPQLDSHDPILDLPALVEGLGPLLPSLLKRLMLPSTRLLIFSTPPMQTSSSLAFNLSLLVRASQTSSTASPPSVRGIVGLHDIPALAEEDKGRMARSQDSASPPGWIAWTSDKILLEKLDLYDVLLDLTPLSVFRTGAHNAAVATQSVSSGLPRMTTTVRAPGKRVSSKPQSWTARELAIFQLKGDEAREAALQSLEDEDHDDEEVDTLKANSSTPSATRSTLRPTSALLVGSPTASMTSTRISRLLLTLYALLRYYTAGSWLLGARRSGLSLPARSADGSKLPSNGRNDRFVLPLGIREDGCARSSLLVSAGDDKRHGDGSRLSTRPIALEDDNDEDEDPLIAAAGGSRRARSRSRSRSRRPQLQEGLADTIEDTSAAVDASEDEADADDLDDAQDSQHTVALAHSLAAVWARWGAHLVREVEALVISRLISNSVAVGAAAPPALLLSSADLADCGLSSSNALDTQLVRSIALRVMLLRGDNQRDVKIGKGLPILRWFV